MIITWNEALRNPELTTISQSKGARLYDALRKASSLRLEFSTPCGVADPAYIGVHDPAYLDDLTNLRVANGFGTKDTTALAHAEASVGAMIRAARLAASNPGVPVLAPVSGFHHAGFDWNYGFCTLNGLVAAALRVKRDRPGIQVLILDGDAHLGDGTEDIITRGGHDQWLTNLSLRPGTWRDALEESLDRPWDLILYQAGADAHEDDPYGAGYLTTEEFAERDKLVFETCARYRRSIAFNLAGGYNGERTLELHVATAAAADRATRLFAHATPA